MTGCVYIASMEGVKGRLKIGCTSGDPYDRIADWGKDTGAPGEPILEYAAYLNVDPQPVETAIHRGLKPYRQKGEWFKVDIAVAVRKVRDVADNQIIREFDRKDVIAEAERIRKQEEQRERERALKEEQRKKEEAELHKKAEGLLRIRLNRNHDETHDPWSTAKMLLWGFVLIPLSITIAGIAFIAVGPVAIVLLGAGLVWWVFNSRKNRPTIEQCLEEVRKGAVIVSCPKCKTKNRVLISKSSSSKCGKIECRRLLPKF